METWYEIDRWATKPEKMVKKIDVVKSTGKTIWQVNRWGQGSGPCARRIDNDVYKTALEANSAVVSSINNKIDYYEKEIAKERDMLTSFVSYLREQNAPD